MRSYTRKKQEHKYIEGVNKLCRLCLQKPEEQDAVVPIFTEEVGFTRTSLALRIMICVGLEVSYEECLPNTVCLECLNELERYYAFRKKCEMAYQKLKSHLNAVRDKETNKAVISIEKTKEHNNNLHIKNEEQNTDVKNDIAEVTNLALISNSQEVDEDKLNYVVNESSNSSEKPLSIVVGDIPQLAEEFNDTKNNIQMQKSPDVTEFLSNMLIELGILNQQEDGLLHNQGVKSVVMEMGDGSTVTLQLEEEDEEETDVKIVNEVLSSEEIMCNDLEQSDVIVKYFTSCNDLPANDDNNGINKQRDPRTWCAPCKRHFASASTLARHMRVHSGVRPFACRACDRRFAQREVCARHELLHSSMRPFMCSVCGRGFTQRASLTVHARSHAPPDARPLRLHLCDLCPKHFLYPSGLSRHMMTHKGVLYECGACQRQFKDKSSLVRHFKNTGHGTNHGNTPITILRNAT